MEQRRDLVEILDRERACERLPKRPRHLPAFLLARAASSHAPLRPRAPGRVWHYGGTPRTLRAGTRKRRPGSGGASKESRRRPTLPPGLPGSTIGARGLNFRVRDGTGCLPSAMATETLWSCPGMPGTSRTTQRARARKSSCQVLGLLVPVSSTHYCASTSGLSTQSSSWGPYQVNPVGDLILERASRLYAFSAYPFRT
jgi:hypothetical protein